MVEPSNRPGDGGEKPDPSDEADLTARLRSLGSRLYGLSSQREEAVRASSGRSSNMTGLGLALRLSAEFVSGIIAGAIVGWGFDQLVGSSPLGLVVGLFLGFAAGMLNMLRGSGELKRGPSSAMAERDGVRSSENKPPADDSGG